MPCRRMRSSIDWRASLSFVSMTILRAFEVTVVAIVPLTFLVAKEVFTAGLNGKNCFFLAIIGLFQRSDWESRIHQHAEGQDKALREV